MQKKLIPALAASLVAASASVAFAAANPFSDVPADHWAYDAVAQLAQDGVIEGYGDGTYRGGQSITRYEMAQMVAKAMAKDDLTYADKALVDKLAAEFADELNNLGVRVASLERNADMVKWTGELRDSYWSYREDGDPAAKRRDNRNQLQLRIFPTAEVNDHWHVKARLTGTVYMDKDGSRRRANGDSRGDDEMKLTYLYAEGKYGNLGIGLGKQILYSYADDGLVIDDFFSGARVQFGGQLKAALEAGRWNIGTDGNDGLSAAGTDTANYQGVELTYAPHKFRAGAAYRHFSSDNFKNVAKYKNGGTSDDANIWSVGLGYRFDKNWDIFAAYADNTEADNYSSSKNFQLSYKGAQKQNAGTWGLYAAYRYFAQHSALMPTMNIFMNNTKGWEVGASYAPFPNVVTYLGYFDGKQIDATTGDDDAKALFGRVRFFF